MTQQRRKISSRVGGMIVALFLGLASLFAPTAAALADPTPVPGSGDSVYVGQQRWISGSAMIFPVWNETPADLSNPGEPDFWAYCIEQTVSAQFNRDGVAGDAESFLGGNYFTDAEVQGKVLWVLAHSYPTLSVDALGAAADIPGLTLEEAISGTTTAIWRYTDASWDASYHWISDNAEELYWYLVNGANASSGMTPADFATTVSVTAPTDPQTASSLVGPFVVNTNQSTASVSSDPAFTLTDASGAPIDGSAVTDGQEIYLDLRDSAAAGSATLTASATGSSATGMVISVPTTPGGTATKNDHAQSMILVAPGSATTESQAAVQWAATDVPTEPVIGTSLVDAEDGDRILPWNGGTVTDTVSYQGLTPGTEYTVTGELMRKSDGTATGITGSTTFTPTEADGEIDVALTVPEGYAGEDLVAFEWLFVGSVAGDIEDAIAEHTDINDAAQTVTVEDVPMTPTPKDTTPVPDDTTEDSEAAPEAEEDSETSDQTTGLASTGADPLGALWALAVGAALLGGVLLIGRRVAQ